MLFGKRQDVNARRRKAEPQCVFSGMRRAVPNREKKRGRLLMIGDSPSLPSQFLCPNGNRTMNRPPHPSENARSLAETDTAQRLSRKIETREATIGVVGLGYVGLPLAVEYAGSDFDTIGIDLDEQRVRRLSAGENCIDDVADEEVAALVETEQLRVEATFKQASEVDVFFVCVPTPVTDTKEPDLTYVESAVDSIAEHLRPGQLVVLKSTTYPGTTEEVALSRLRDAAEDRGLAVEQARSASIRATRRTKRVTFRWQRGR